VIRKIGEDRRSDYAQTLLRVLNNGNDTRMLPAALGIVESGAGMKRRFRRILEFRPRRVIVTALGGVALAGLAAVAFGQEKKHTEEAKGEAITFASLRDVLDQVLVAARQRDAEKINAIWEMANDRHLPLRSEDANMMLEKLIQERDLGTFSFLLGKFRRSGLGKDWQPSESTVLELLRSNRQDFIEVMLSYRLKTDILFQAAKQVGGPTQTWAETRAEQVRSQQEKVDRLVDASKTGNTQEMARLLDAGVDVDGVGSDDFTPLTRAAVSGQAAAVRLLLSRGAQVDKPRLPGWNYTALCLAKTVEIAQMLKDAGADVNAKLYERETPILSYPVRWASTDVVKWFLDQGVDAKQAAGSDPTLLFEAGRAETAELLIERGVGVHELDKRGETALFNIIRYVKKPAKTAEVLLNHGADPNARNSYGQTPLMVAPDGATVEALIAAGADLTAKDDRGNSVFQFSGGKAQPDREEAFRRHGVTMKDPNEGVQMLNDTILSNDVVRAKSLLAEGVSPDASSVGFQQYPESSAMSLAAFFGRFEILDGMRAAGGQDVGFLSQAASEGDIEKMKKLLSEGAKVNEETNFGQTPLSFAIRRGQLEAVRVLVEAGADPMKFDGWGSSPLIFAEFMEIQWKGLGSRTVTQTDLSPQDEEAFYPKAIAIMAPHATKGEMIDARGDTALTKAAACGNSMSAPMLIKRGANINYQRPDGLTPLMIAVVNHGWGFGDAGGFDEDGGWVAGLAE